MNFHKINELGAARSSELLLFVDVAPNWLCHSAFGIAMSAFFYQLPSLEHGKSGVISFADGHVETHRWVETASFDMAKAPFVTHLNFSLSANADLTWLRQHATESKP